MNVPSPEIEPPVALQTGSIGNGAPDWSKPAAWNWSALPAGTVAGEGVTVIVASTGAGETSSVRLS